MYPSHLGQRDWTYICTLLWYIYMYVCLCVCVCVCVCVCICICIMYTYIYTYTCIYIYDCASVGAADEVCTRALSARVLRLWTPAIASCWRIRAPQPRVSAPPFFCSSTHYHFLFVHSLSLSGSATSSKRSSPPRALTISKMLFVVANILDTECAKSLQIC
jgi:hypothetical protein